MELLQLRYFCALAEKQHLTNTAKQLMIAPPSLSLTISKLETELGLKLFDRVNRNITLNENGELFYKYIKESLHLIDEGTQRIKEICRENANTIRIAVTSPLIWNNFFSLFQEDYPEITLEVTTVDIEEMNMDDFEYDFFMGNGWDLDLENFHFTRLGRNEKNLLLVSKKHRLASRRTVSMGELKDETFITLGKINSTTNKYVNAACAEHGFTPRNILEATYFTRISYLHENKGVVLISDLGFRKHVINDGRIHKIEIKDLKKQRYQVIAWKVESFQSDAIKLFYDTVINYQIV